MDMERRCVVSKFLYIVCNCDLFSKCCERKGNSGYLSIENKWPINWASVGIFLWKNIKRSFKYFEQCSYKKLVHIPIPMNGYKIKDYGSAVSRYKKW